MSRLQLLGCSAKFACMLLSDGNESLVHGVIADAVDLARHGEFLDQTPIRRVVERHLLAARAHAQYATVQRRLPVAHVARRRRQSLHHRIRATIPYAHILLSTDSDDEIVIGHAQHVGDRHLVVLQQCCLGIRLGEIEDACRAV